MGMIVNMTEHYRTGSDIKEDESEKDQPVELDSGPKLYTRFSGLDKGTCTRQLHFPDGTVLPCLVDTGATSNVIAESTLAQSKYLGGLKRRHSGVHSFMVGDNVEMTSTEAVDAVGQIGDKHLATRYHILPTCGAFPIILGLKSLQEVGAMIDLDENVLYIRQTRIVVKSKYYVKVAPGETKTVEVVTRMPHALNNIDIIITLTGKIGKLGRQYALVRFNKNATFLRITNTTQEQINLTPHYIMGNINTRDVLTTLVEVPQYVWCDENQEGKPGNKSQEGKVQSGKAVNLEQQRAIFSESPGKLGS
jgi:hypothetical protein